MTMEASVSEAEIRNFTRFLQCASRFGDDLNIHANKDRWELAVTNANKTAFCLFKLRKAFFVRYKAEGSASAQRRGVKCELLVKSVLAVLGKSGSMTNVTRLDLKIQDSDASLVNRKRRKSTSLTTNGAQTGDDEEYNGSGDDEDEGGIGAKLIIKLVCKHGVTKKHSLHLNSSEFLRAEVDPDSTPSSFHISAKTLRDMLDHFAIAAPTGMGSTGGMSVRTENQLGWMFSKREIRIKSWEMGNQALTTEIRLDEGEFDDYWVEAQRVDLALPMKEFRAALTLAEQVGVRLCIAFSEASQPLTLTSVVEENEDDQKPFDIFCAIATTTCAAFASVAKSESSAGPSTNTSRQPSLRTSTNPDQPPSTSDKRPSEPPERSTSARPPSSTRLSSTAEKRKRSTLNLTTDSNQAQTSVVMNTQAVQDPDNPLFLPHSQGSQGDQPFDEGIEAGNGGDEMQLRPSQRPRMSQAEVMEMTGLGDINDIMDGLDDMEEEDEKEAEEEMRLSQMPRSPPQEERGHEERESNAENIPPVGGEETEFLPDDDVFGDEKEEEAVEFDPTQSQIRSQSTRSFVALFPDD